MSTNHKCHYRAPGCYNGTMRGHTIPALTAVQNSGPAPQPSNPGET